MHGSLGLCVNTEEESVLIVYIIELKVWKECEMSILLIPCVAWQRQMKY